MAYATSFTNDEVKHRILNIYAQFVSDVDPERLFDWLVQEHVITIDQKLRIRHETPITSDRCRALLDHLFSTQHPRAFLVVRQALSKENHYLLEYIDNQERKCLLGEHPETNAVLQAKIQELENDLMIYRSENTLLLKKEEDLKQRVHQLESELHSEEGSVELKKRTKQVLSAKQITEIDFLRKENKALEDNIKQLKQELETKAGKLDPHLVLTIRTRAAKIEKKPISGLTILDKELFVVNDESSEIEVYDSMKLSFIRRWNLKELIDPNDIVSCNRNKCIYINDYKVEDQSKEILRVNPNGRLIKNWSTGYDNGWGLSVTEESHVILAVEEKNKLNEYSPDGQLIREINLSANASIRRPLHAIKLTNGHFVVGHGSDDDDYLHRVCIVDADGNLMKSFGGERGSTITQMNYPAHLTVDGNGFVMVADRRNNRVLLLDPDLKFTREILPKGKHGLRNPRRIFLESNDRLFVADKDDKGKIRDGQILIFDFK